MRRAFVGLSGPLAYCYKQQSLGNSRPPPNPILEDSLGLLILYDEIVFLAPDLCPENMRHLPYVKFLSDRRDYAVTMGSVLTAAKQRYELNDKRDPQFGDPFATYKPALETVTGQSFRYDAAASKYVPDNHGRRFTVVDDISACGSSTWLQNVIADWTAVEQFGLADCEVISNSGNAIFYRSLQADTEAERVKRAVGHALVLKGLPNYLDTDGPYHPCLEELRQHEFIEDARTHIDTVTRDGTAREVGAIGDEILKVAKKIRREVFSKHMRKHNEYAVVAKAGLKEGLGLLLPGVGLLSDLVEARSAKRSADSLRWAGFVADVADADWTVGRL